MDHRAMEFSRDKESQIKFRVGNIIYKESLDIECTTLGSNRRFTPVPRNPPSCSLGTGVQTRTGIAECLLGIIAR